MTNYYVQYNGLVTLHIINVKVWSPSTQETMEARTAVMEVIEVPDDRLTLCPPRGEILCPRLACPRGIYLSSSG